MELVLHSLIDTTAAPFLEEYEARKLRASLKQQITLSVDWHERPLASEAIDQAFAATPLGASEAELRAVAKKAIQAAIRKGEERVQTEEAERKRAEAKRTKEGQLSASRIFYIPEELRALARKGILDDEEISDRGWVDDVIEAVSALEEELTGDQSSEHVQEQVRQLVAEELKL